MSELTTPNGFHYVCRFCGKQFDTYDAKHVHYNDLEAGHASVIRTVEDLPEFTPELIDVFGELAASSYGLGNRWVIDWERFYEMLESFHGWDMQDYGGTADEKIRRVARKRMKELEAEGLA